MQNRELFLAAGGERYQYIEALNDSPGHVAMLAGLVERECRSWMPEIEAGNSSEAREARRQRAVADGADA
jgi:ferrochelatase